MISDTKDFLRLLDKKARWQLALLAILMCAGGAAEVLGIGSVVAFLGLIAKPEILNTNTYLIALHSWTGLDETTSFITFLGLAMVLSVTLSNAFQAAISYGVLGATLKQQRLLTMRLLSIYFARDYLWFLSNNSAELGKTILTEVSQVTTGMLRPILNFLGNTVRGASIAIFLLVVDAEIALVCLATAGLAFGSLSLATRKRLTQMGAERLNYSRFLFKSANEMLAGIKEVKLFGVERKLLSKFDSCLRQIEQIEIYRNLLSTFPKYFAQTFALGGVSILALVLHNRGESDSSVFATLSLFAVGGYRLIGACQTSFTNFSNMKVVSATLTDLRRQFSTEPLHQVRREELVFEKNISFDAVSFAYPGSEVPVLDKTSFQIAKNSKVAFVGSTGAGKTTIINLLLGLFQPSEGTIKIDGRALTTSTFSSWTEKVGYVPQDIFLIDDTIEKNIAFGSNDDEVEREAIEHASRIAQIHDFIQELPQGYNTVIGERGVRLSGGQRQRLGLARALYRDPEVLILDEATSALDGATEANLVSALEESQTRKTVVVVAHRMQTVKHCDEIFHLLEGQIFESGSFNKLLANSASFRSLAGRQEKAVDNFDSK